MSTISIKGAGDVYLVDDDPHFHILIQFIFKRHPDVTNNLITFSSGDECLQHLDSTVNNNLDLPSLILMDINMPGLSGIETVELIRSNPNYTSLPIVAMLSSSNFQGDIDKSFAAGANEYIEKPFNINEMVLERAD